MSEIGDRIKYLRNSNNLTQDEFGKRFGIVKSTVSMYESGKSAPDDSTKVKICQCFGCTMDYLYGLTDYPLASSDKLLDESERRLLNAYRSLSEDNQTIALAKILELKREDQLEKANAGLREAK